MAIKHKIVINVSDRGGRKANVLRGADVKEKAVLITSFRHKMIYANVCNCKQKRI